MKLIIVCGPTGTGKTRLGIRIARKFNGEIISADSRQVYKFMDIGTGKEWDSGKSPVKIWGYDLVDPTSEFSVSQFVDYAKSKIVEIQTNNKIPIIVGGTGFYIKALIDGIETINIPVNTELRNNLIDKSVSELFEKLATLDSAKAASLNNSDRHNPRRLIRAIEVAIWNMEHPKSGKIINNKDNYQCLWIGLKNKDLRNVSDNIFKKIEKRIEDGFVDEVENLLKMGVSWKMQSMMSLGYRESEGFFKSGLSYEEFINLWHLHEFDYYKRQMTWFNKMTNSDGKKRIEWFYVDDDLFVENVDKYVNSWDNINV